VQDEASTAAVARRSAKRLDRARELATACARLADDNRGKEILLLDLRAATSLVDYFVLITASSRRQAQAIASEIDAEMKRLGESKLGREGTEEGRWILIDYGDFVVHVFSEDARTYYALEDIWGDSLRIDWVDPNRPVARPRPVAEPPALDDASD
jgi:ribosome-associated protein